MDEDLYDEFGNYIGPDLAEGSAESESEDWDRAPGGGQGSGVRIEDDAMDLEEEGAPARLLPALAPPCPAALTPPSPFQPRHCAP